MRRREQIHVAGTPESATELTRTTLSLGPDLTGEVPGLGGAPLQATVTAADGDDSALVVLEGDGPVRVPFFQWFFGPVFRWELRRGVRHAIALIDAAAHDRPPPPAPSRTPLTPPVAFTTEQQALIATVSFAALLASFAAALFGQNADGIAKSFDISDNGLGQALALTRSGALFALFAAALADRIGRRRVFLYAVAGVCLANAASAVAPSIETFTIAQTVLRACGNAAVVVGGIAVIEEAPEGARAFALAMLALAGGAGFALAVLLLPLADLGGDSWRIAFAISGLTIVLLPMLARRLHETRRYTTLAARTEKRGQLREVFDRKYGKRFLLLAGVGFLTNIFSAPSAQLTNRYLSDVHDFSSSGIALFRGVTQGLPGLIGILLAGRLAETRGRRPVAIVGLFLGTALTMIFFVGGGPILWVTATLAIIAGASATLSIGTMDAELFPTEVRGSSNALLLVCYVAGSAVGLLAAGQLSDPMGGLGYAIALCGIAPLLAAVFLLPRLPESQGRELDDVSPSEV